MTELFEPTDAHDPRLARGATGMLARFNDVHLLESADVHVAERVAALGEEPDESVRLALALAVRAVRAGSVCIDLATVHRLTTDVPDLPWPRPDAWRTAVAASPLVAAGVLHLEGDLVYLDRYHRLERQVCDDLVARLGPARCDVDETALLDTVARLDRSDGGHFSPEQRDAVLGAVRRATTVLTGGPGTGKTTTVARMLVSAQAAAGGVLSIALAAPTGKAATRLQEAVADELAELDALGAIDPGGRSARELVGPLEAMTLHRLLGWRPDNSTRFRHHRGNRLKYDLIVVDECSMVELTLMARLLEAVRPEARLVLVGDPRQLTSVGAGAVLSDIVAGFDGHRESPVAALTENFRSTADIKTLAAALLGDASGEVDPDAVLAALRVSSAEVTWIDSDDAAAVLRDDLVRHGLALREAAESGRSEAAVALLDEQRLLCAHREGPFGVRHWNQQVERWLAEALDEPFLGAGALGGNGDASGWYGGRPLLVTSNDYALDVYNGETGVAVRASDGRLRAVVSGSRGLQDFAPGRLDAVDTMHAMTIHKSQGSQAARVTVLLPDASSRLLTRELFYTAVTRAQQHVRVVGTEAAVRAAVAQRAQRATGLAERLRAARNDSATSRE